MRRWRVLLGAALLPFAVQAQTGDRLRIVLIDVEGGAATLFVTPQGHSLLIDTGWPQGMGGPRAAPGVTVSTTPSSAERIIAAARAAGLKRIDHLLLTHYHVDHIGGFQDLFAAFPIGDFIDHGPNREEAPPGAASPTTTYAAYLQAIAGRPHRVMAPGETLRIDELLITAVDSDRRIPPAPLAGAGRPGVGCAGVTGNSDIGGEENPRSLGIVATWGKARILALGDTTWDVETSLVCPRDLIGPIDLMIADNHGSANSGNPVLLDTVRPTVYLFNNGPAKGADGASLSRVAAAPYIRGMWQVHFATRSPDRNAPADQIANLDGPDATHPLRIAVSRDGAIAVTNPRTGLTKSYAKAAR